MNSAYETVKQLCEKTKSASRTDIDRHKRNEALAILSEKLVSKTEAILEANRKDTENALNAGISEAMLDRLTLTDKRIASIASSVLKVHGLADPTGIGSTRTLENGLKVTKISVPLGVVGIIYEARPNVTVDAAEGVPL